ncbi:helix-turn-helix transcriptional regulator [Shewanella sp. KX20019]|uniref:helix-turn-helix transcriptional regulator n=1 Tax=Shewanella sp. KX20019 TaxID=2803864 RepID=UPI001925E885|nr:helix-turn-helix transcriptional regulator [Shewanella sp. KX20019]QQX80813.1 helix-turn-helix transcriptional regulator [Shewanella sp. KX20019]
MNRRIKEAREFAGFTQVSAALRLGMARQTYLDMETGKTEPRCSMAIQISILFKCDLLYLITGDNSNEINLNKILKNKRFVITGSIMGMSEIR